VMLSLRKFRDGMIYSPRRPLRPLNGAFLPGFDNRSWG
jgi:hypothetical protein